MRNSVLWPLLASTAIPCLPALAVASDEPLPPAVQERLDSLERKVRLLERQLEVDQETKLADKAKQTATVSAGAEGFALKSNDGAFQLKLRGLLQADGRFFFDGENTPVAIPNNGNDDTFLLRRVRPILEGTVFNIFDFRFMPDFPSNTSRNATIQDAWVDARLFPWFQVKGGKFKTPFGIEQLQSASSIRFVERALPNNLVPNRDIGVEVHGDIGSGVLSYSAAWLNGVNDGRSSEDFGDFDNNVDKDLAARIFAHPFQNTGVVPLQGFGLGFAVSYVDASGNTASTNLPDYRTPGQQRFFAYRTGSTATVADGERLRLSPQAYYYYGPFGLLGEYVCVSQDVRRTVGATSRSDELRHEAWQIAASYMLTGEDSTYKGVKPKRPVSLANGTWGALELAFRYSELNLDQDSFAGGSNSFADPTTAAEEAAAWAMGLNWYLNNNVKFVLDYEQTDFEGGGGGTASSPLDREDEKVLLSRIQLYF
ncbi:MAG: OprO/OprP family phosphate-selective porin [Gammaproteobacteria bacterium]